MHWVGGVPPWGVLLSGAYTYALRTRHRSRMTTFKSGPLLALLCCLLPELRHRRQGVALIQSHVDPLPAPQPVLWDGTSRLVGHIVFPLLSGIQRVFSAGLQWLRR